MTQNKGRKNKVICVEGKLKTEKKLNEKQLIFRRCVLQHPRAVVRCVPVTDEIEGKGRPGKHGLPSEMSSVGQCHFFN